MLSEILREVVTYDPLATIDQSPANLRPIQRWLSDDSARWLNPRPTPDPNTIANGKFQLFVGEAGCGKTTQLNFEAQRLDATKHLVIRLDFTNATELIVADLRSTDAVLGNLFLAAVDNAVRNAGLFNPYSASQVRNTLRNEAHYTLSGIRARFLSELEDLDDDFLLESKDIQRGITAFRTQQSNLAQGVSALKAAQDLPSHRCVLLIDNIDHLHERKVHKVFGLLAGAITGRTVVFLALRNEHEGFSEELGLKGQRDPLRLECDGSSIDIVRRRLRNARLFAEERSLGSEVLQQIDQCQELVNKVAEDEVSTRLIEEWNNANFRQILSYYAALFDEMGNDASTKNIRAFLVDIFLARSRDSSLDFFSPSRVYCARFPDLPFVFLRLRLLAYLRRFKHGVAISRLYRDFDEGFGLSPSDIDDAMDSLCWSPGKQAFVRRTSRILVDLGEEPKAILLPAGKCMQEVLVYRVAFLEWVYLHDANPPKVRGGRGLRLRRAVAAVEHLILPLFEEEHPYMTHTGRIEARDTSRLNLYSRLFDYGKNGWFIDGLRISVVEYGSLRQSHVRRLNDEVARMTKRLDDVMRENRAVAGPLLRENT